MCILYSPRWARVENWILSLRVKQFEKMSSSISEDDAFAKRGIRLFLHLIDKSDSPNRSTGTHQEPLYDAPNDHTVILHVGKGTQTLKWLALAAQGRLKMLRRRNGRLRSREIRGRDVNFLPEKVTTTQRGRHMDPYARICDVFKNEGHVWIEFDESGGNVTHWKEHAFKAHEPGTLAKGIPLEAPYDHDTIASPRLTVRPNSPPQLLSPPNASLSQPPSVMTQRAYECDSRSYYDTVDTIMNALLYDWKTHLNQPKHITVTQDKWMELEPFYPSLLSIYRYYATAGHNDASPHKDSPFLLHKTSFQNLMTRCVLPPQLMSLFGLESSTTAENDVEVAEEEGIVDGIAETEDVTTPEEVVVVSEEIERYEFMEIILLMAAQLSEQSEEKNPAFADSLGTLLTEHILMKAWLEVPHGWWFAHPNSFRFRRLYREETNAELIKRVDKLWTIFLSLAASSQRRLGIIGEKVNPQVAYEEFYDLLRKGGMLRGKHGVAPDLVRASFAFAQMVNTDDMKVRSAFVDPAAFSRCTFVEFLECLTWLAEIQPKTSVIKSVRFSQDLSLLLDSVLGCVSHDFWTLNKIKSFSLVSSRFGRDYNMSKRLGASPEIGQQELTYENEAHLLEQLDFSGRALYALPPRVVGKLGKMFFTYSS